MKAFLLTLLAAGSAGLTAQAQWVNQPINFTPARATALHLDVVDANTVWAVSQVVDATYAPPQLARTTDGGRTWTVSTLPLRNVHREDVLGLSAPSPSTAWIVTVPVDSAGSRILRTTDGGQTWTVQGRGTVFYNAFSFADFVHFFSTTEGVVCGEQLTPAGGFELYRTTDAGQTWTPVPTPAAQPNEGAGGRPVVFGNSIWFMTDKGRVFRSTDRGQTWAVSALPVPAEPTGLAFRDAQKGLISVLDESGTDHELYRTTDGGQTWTAVAYTGPLHGIALAAVPGTTQYVSTGTDIGNGDGGSSYSRDNGQTWTALENTTDHLAVEFVSPTVGWSGGVRMQGPFPVGNGVNRFDSNVLSTRKAEAAALAGWQLAPNPAADGQTTLRATRPLGAAQVRVRDVAGRLVREYAWSGTAPLTLDLSQQTAGLYVVEVAGATGSAHQKIQVR
ncbi:T9SS type A sorting domain-containing protein [Hymenobacter gummosus]|uniref:T9SS type A sorting domain-containing protein n=1 Tax=Hymenobacter gummosus TaxID=1776032 RepID=A0A3S0JL42_9BACT|nr:T9SS type A sorting domain-containing protein [Hymenobacter gummosus]RTQ53700.1 T9SS type A sorting domain-containing protein [Hymenobacter gummosus]